MTRLLAVGLSSWLVEVDESDAQPLSRYLAGRRDEGELPGVVDVVPGATTVLLEAGATGPDQAVLRGVIEAWRPGPAEDDETRTVEIPVVYDGEDLDDVAERAGLDRQAVIDRHTGADLRVAFCGFNAGFAYIDGLPAELRLPRLQTPRTAVPPGSVAIADRYTAVYPRRSPGGWRLIGRTDLPLWDENHTPPALLTPGTRVRFTER